MKKDFILLALGLLVFFMIGLGAHPYSVPSEARYIAIPSQMIQLGDWLTPHINGVKYFEKPPLFYWVQAAQIKIFGAGEFSGRLWTTLFMTGLCLVTFIAGYKKYGRLEGVISALILASCVLGFVSSRMVLLDVPVSFFLVVTLFSFMFAVQHPPGRRRDGLLMLMYVAAALAVLTKGLIGILIPGMVIGAWIALSNRWSLLLSVRLIPGLLLFLIIAAPWHFLVGQETPEFYHFYFIHEHFERFLTKTHGRYQPPWFFVAVLLVGLLPWTAFLFQALQARLKTAWGNRKHDGSDFFLLLWIALPLLFFSLSDSKLVPYILPVFPALALFVSRYLSAIWRTSGTAGTVGYRVGVFIVAAVFIAVAEAYPIMMHIGGKAAFIITPIKAGMGLLSVVLTVQAMALLLMVWRKVPPPKLISWMVIFSLIFISGVGYLAPKAATRSMLDSAKPFALFLKPKLHSGDEVVAYGHYYQDFPVYLERNVTVVASFGEMSFGRSIEPRTHEWMIEPSIFKQRWQQKDHRLYVLVRRTEYNESTFPKAKILLDNGGRNLLITNDLGGQ